ncbi:tryptophan synthase subunit alpha [Methylobacillus flagellatus]|uniref:tryptophan synthase subunit alpha n=1 Tax=Methylobacillus flagellatus TaxID=405 RepID=UPI0028540407|nr:tryptophan synthase subunit alpha [Methylobacillus flagellatus]MDR5171659.1 tryptophan synthase subunit alpha [Methylobacillus flagellatus]
MSRIQATFAALKSQGKKALIPYITAGDPHPKHTVALMHALVQSGSDIIELGVPFSDPMADGPVIQRATERALAHKVGLGDVLEMVREFRQTDDKTPIVLMGYANPIEAMGQAKFAERAHAAGVDGVLTVDYPPEECQDFVELLKTQQLDPIFLLSPTSESSRVDMIVRQAAGFVYYVSLKGVTGSKNLDIVEVGGKVKAIRGQTDLPIGVGFGVRDAATAKAVAEVADAVVIGSRMIQEIENSSEDDLLSNVVKLTQSMRAAIDDTKR